MGTTASTGRPPVSASSSTFTYPGSNRGRNNNHRRNPSSSSSASGSSSTRVAAGGGARPPPPSQPSNIPTTTTTAPTQTSASTPNGVISRPGAYSISHDPAGPTQVYRVQIPMEVRPGQEFQVVAGTRTVRVRCPTESRGGQYLQITIPPEPVVTRTSTVLGMAVLTCANPGMDGEGGLVRMNEDIARVNTSVLQRTGDDMIRGGGVGGVGGGSMLPSSSSSLPPSGLLGQQQQQSPTPSPAPTTYMVTIPRGIYPGMQFMVDIDGQRMMVTCPPDVQAGMSLRILPPPPAPTTTDPTLSTAQGTALDRPPPSSSLLQPNPASTSTQQMMQMFEVVVPPGVQPNQSFSLLANGQRVLVTCPPNVRPGMKVRFQLPISSPLLTTNGESVVKSSGSSVQLEYESIKDGWARTLRVTDMKFVWVRLDMNGNIVDCNTTTTNTASPMIGGRDDDDRGGNAIPKKFDNKHSAYTRRLIFLEGNDPRMRTGVLSLGPANESAGVESSVTTTSPTGQPIVVVGYAEIASAANQCRQYDEKVSWFQEICRERLRIKWSDGHLRILVRRGHTLLHDSMEAVMSLGRNDLRKYWRFEFMGETGIDAGGLAREWFQLVTEAIFNPDMGLWLPSASNQMAMRINPASKISCPEDHLIYFRFLGRVMGKALFDGHLVSGHMVRHMYKHILGWPVMFEDLKLPDEEYYNSLKSLLEVDTVEDLCVDFTFTESALGENRIVELMEGGKDVPVTNDNLPDFLEANLKFHLLDRVKPQLTELLLGFYDVIPESLLTIFDFQELELLMCGVPVIDIDDWMANTSYLGQFEDKKDKAKTVQWFWELVRDEFDQETRARLLQFVTGTSGVPSRGFAVLQGNDGSIRKFCINGIKKEDSFYPRSQ